ncbi:MAG TPA: hypothetical protein ENG51_00335 [Deltaproteobacteria bacterium]|nr:MAG: hypothetical protein DRG83_08595 [Deltaproteobacteria bacterium]RLB08662.1 MAG: hypothetical protein DRG59_04410 [Deltaproteobacteria bacterium]HDM74901.1 hypothetical protein [Deltaproteobacteria bacterium]
MPDIKYVCLSDMHLGEEDSLLTNINVQNAGPDFSRPSPVLELLVKCLKTLIAENEGQEKPVLILNGDILELALAFVNEAAMAFERFIELLVDDNGTPLFEHIIYIPGNHDHHIWEIARETQYVHYIREIEAGKPLEPPKHTTDLFFESFDDMVASYFLSNLIMRYPTFENIRILVAYPNLGITTRDGKKCVLFHHGHYIESIYQLISTLRSLLFDTDPPDNIEEIEAENFAWIDFFWSALGRSGKAGEAVESIYERMLSISHFHKLISDFAKNAAEKYDLPGWGDWMEAKFLEKVLNSIADKLLKRERAQRDLPLSSDAERGLWKYVEGPLLKQLRYELTGMFPSQIGFVFGHTHKPFQQDLHFAGYQGWVDVYNTGGWVIDSVAREPVHGASVVLADEDLNLTCLRMYNEAEEPEDYKVEVKRATHAGELKNSFHERIKTLVSRYSGLFGEFSQTVAREVYIRAQLLRSRLIKLD